MNLGKQKLRINPIPWQQLSTRTTTTTESSLITNTRTQSGILSLLLRSDGGPQKGNSPDILLKTKRLILPTIIVRSFIKILRDSRNLGMQKVLLSTEKSSRTSWRGSRRRHLKEIGWDLTSKGRNNRSENPPQLLVASQVFIRREEGVPRLVDL